MEHLNLYDSPISAKAMAVINSMPNLQVLRLGGIAVHVQAIDNCFGGPLRLSCQNLQELSLSHSNVDDEAIKVICLNCKHLSKLSLVSSLLLTTVEPLASLTKLTNLDLLNCENIGSVSPLGSLTALENLNLQKVGGVTGTVRER